MIATPTSAFDINVTAPNRSPRQVVVTLGGREIYNQRLLPTNSAIRVPNIGELVEIELDRTGAVTGSVTYSVEGLRETALQVFYCRPKLADVDDFLANHFLTLADAARVSPLATVYADWLDDSADCEFEVVCAYEIGGAARISKLGADNFPHTSDAVGIGGYHHHADISAARITFLLPSGAKLKGFTLNAGSRSKTWWVDHQHWLAEAKGRNSFGVDERVCFHAATDKQLKTSRTMVKVDGNYTEAVRDDYFVYETKTAPIDPAEAENLLDVLRGSNLELTLSGIPRIAVVSDIDATTTDNATAEPTTIKIVWRTPAERPVIPATPERIHSIEHSPEFN